MFKNSFLAAILLLSLFSTQGLCDFSRVQNLQKALPLEESKHSFSVFIISTEMVIGRARPILEKAPSGLFVTVGSERGFRGASMAPGTTHLLLLDFSPSIVRFNRMNAELLKAPTLREYRKLRWDSSYQDWVKFA